ncbi:MAG: outer membrane protein assembly factor BamA [Candidatus Omnitrophota bacterium]|jgi:outer membrane protein insertion porin family
MSRRFWSVFFLALLAGALAGYAQESGGKSDELAKAVQALDEAPEAAEPAAAGKPAAPTQQSPAQQPNIIADVQVKGNRIVSTNTILSKIQSRKGGQLVQETVNGDVKRLYSAGFFEDIQMEVEEKPEGYVLVVSVVEKPIIRTIKIKGFSIFKEEKLRKTLKVVEGQILDRQAVKQGVEEIRKMYAEKGYRFVDVQSEADVDSTTKEAIVTITILEGESYRIRSVKFEGVKAFKPKKLAKLMKTKQRNLWLFRRGVFNEGKFQKDIERIKLYYQQEGYLDVRVEPRFDYDKEHRAILIAISAEEGKHYVTGEIKIQGNKLFPESEIWQRLEMLPGMTYSQYYLSKDVEAARDYYQEQGYMDARVVPDIGLNKDTGKVDVTYQIEEGDLYFVEKVVVRGNTKTKDMVIRRELRIRPGERFDGEKIKKSKQRLENLNYFEEITYDTEPTQTPNRKDLIFRVKEKRTGELSFGGGISSVDNLVGFAEIAQRNFDLFNWPRFTGGGQSVSLGARIGTISQNFNLNFTEPYLFNRPYALSTDLYNTRRDDKNVDYNEGRLGAGTTLSRAFKDVFRAGGGYTFERVELYDLADDAPDTVRKFDGKTWLSRMKTFGSYDTRDSIISPMKGQLASLGGELIGTFLGGDESYYILNAAYTYYWNVFKKHLLEMKARVGVSDSLSGSDEVPVFDRFYAGGLGTVRGYEYRRVGPMENGDAVGGQSMAIINMEYSVPIPYLEGFRGAVFMDAGQVNSDTFDFGFNEVAMSVGPGLKMKTPIGPIAFYYGYPVANPDEKNENGRFEFSFGRGF